MAFNGFVNLLERADLSNEDRLMVCQMLAELAGSSAANAVKIVRTEMLPEAFSAILNDPGTAFGQGVSHTPQRTDERHQSYIALCISRCASKNQFDELGQQTHTEICMKLTRTEALIDGLWNLKKHPEPFVQICASVALTTLCQCNEAVGINRRLMRFKWNTNVLQSSAPPLRRSFGCINSRQEDETSHPAHQSEQIWRIEEDRIVSSQTAPPNFGPSAHSISNNVPASNRYCNSSNHTSAQSLHGIDGRAQISMLGLSVAHVSMYAASSCSSNRWEGMPSTEATAPFPVEKEDSWASARDTKPSSGYFSAQQPGRSPYSSTSSAGTCDVNQGSAGPMAPARIYSRADVSFDSSAMKHCVQLSASTSNGSLRPSGVIPAGNPRDHMIYRG